MAQTITDKVRDIRNAIRNGEPTEFLIRDLRSWKASGRPMTAEANEILRSA
jgi:hypothetical protein